MSIAVDLSKLPTRPRKALVALVGTALTGVGTAWLDGALTWAELGAAAGASLLAAGVVWRVPNPVNADALRGTELGWQLMVGPPGITDHRGTRNRQVVPKDGQAGLAQSAEKPWWTDPNRGHDG